MKKNGKLIRRLLYAVIAVILLSLFSGCANYNIAGNAGETQSENFAVFTSYRDIPGVTEEEINAIEALLEEYDYFVYAMMPNIEAFLDKNGEIRGYSALLCEWLTEIFGIEFVPTHFAWNELMEGLENYEIDFAGNLTATDERREVFYMTDPIAQRTVKYLRLTDSSSLSEISRTRLPRYGLLEGSSTIDKVFLYAAQEFEPVYLAEYADAYELLKSGEIDALIYESSAEAIFGAYDNIVTSDFLPLIFTPVSLATKNPELSPIISVMQKALDNGIIFHLNELYNQGYAEYMRYRLSMRLTEEESEYIKNNPVISFAIEYDDYPVSFYSMHYNEWQGISIDVIKEIEMLTGLEFVTLHDVDTGWTELLRMLEDGEVLILSELVRTKEREESFLWAESSFFTDQSALLSKTEHRDININDVYSVKVGLIKDNANAEMFRSWFPDHHNVVEYESNQAAFDALKRDEVDMVMSSKSSLLYLTNYQEVTGYKANIVFNNSFESTFGFNKDAEILRSIVDKSLDLIDVEAISEQWLRKNYDYRLKMTEAQRPWVIGVCFLLFSTSVLMFALFQRTRREGKRLDDLVKERSETIVSLFEVNPQINFLFNSKFKVVDCNSVVCKVMGFDTKKAALKGFVERINESQPDFQLDGSPVISLSERLERAVENGSEKFEAELTINDNLLTFDVYLIKIPYEDSHAVVGYAFDITDIHKREKALLHAQELSELQLLKLGLMIKATKIGLWDMEVVNHELLNLSNPFIWSQEFRQMLGFKDESDFPNVLSSWSERLHPDDKDRTLECFKKHLLDKTGKTLYDVEYKLKKKNGKYAYFRASGETIRDDNGNAVRVAGALMDITETKNMLLETEKQRIQAEAASKAKGDFLSIMSHEMRTPMNAIIGMTVIGKKAGEIEQKNYALKKIGDASSHLLGVINDVLDMAKIEADKLELAPVEYSFERMLQKTISIINFRIDEKQQIFSAKVDNDIPHFIIGDSQRLAQVIANLLSNAVKFTPEGGKIRLEADLVSEIDGDCELRIQVIDSGIGIDPSQQQRLFLAFEQADRETSHRFGGTGLGLVISKRIIELMGGNIFVESEVGKGARFCFTVKARRGEKNVRSLLTPDVNWEDVRILVADNTAEARSQFEGIFSRLGLKCDVTSDGAEVIRMIEKHGNYDMCFIDNSLPDIDGAELAKQIKSLCADDNEPTVAVITAGMQWEQTKTRAESAEVNKYLPKPVFSFMIIDALNGCLTQYCSQDKDYINNDGVFVGRRMLLAEDIEINREILTLLLENTGIIIDYAENGREALGMVTATPDKYDVVFMDVQMPVMDGLEATREIRALPEITEREGGRLPIIALTANVFKDDIEACLAAGMDDHLGKPFDVDKVFEKLRKFLKT
ncbi:MAG: transporter substrate-binding domain-containing protein [Oscillospiraceae bacterium]|nr:transporter substrate-binding domain-containing protein [Oscillospiraceae bacterium]